MNDQLIDKLFDVVEEADAENSWLDMLKDYQNQYGNVAEVCSSENGWTLLHFAAENLFAKVAHWLIQQGVDVDALDKNYKTPFLVGLDAALDCAVQENLDEIDFSIVLLLLSSGANQDVVSKDKISKEKLLKIYGDDALKQYVEQVENTRNNVV